MKTSSKSSNAIEQSPIRIMFELQKKYDNVISFGLGEPDFPTPKIICETCKKYIDLGKTKYAPNAGIPELREAISRKIQRSHGVTYDPKDEILVCSSGMDALRVASQALLDEGDEIIFTNPYWANHPTHARMVGAVPVYVPVYEKDGFMYDPANLEKAITPKTRVILLNSPSNPTGGVIDMETLVKICQIAQKHDLLIFSDEVYQKIIYDGIQFISPAMLPGMKERVVILDSFSKTYSMTGWRLGYACASPAIIDSMTKVHEFCTSCCNTFVQYTMAEILDGPQDYVDEMVAAFEHRRNILYEGFNNIDGLSCIKPHGTFYVFANISGSGLSSQDFAVQLLTQQQVCTVPGDAFGSAGEGFVRLSYPISDESIQEGLRRMEVFMKGLKKKA